jgi:hypothetical protein
MPSPPKNHQFYYDTSRHPTQRDDQSDYSRNTTRYVRRRCHEIVLVFFSLLALVCEGTWALSDPKIDLRCILTRVCISVFYVVLLFIICCYEKTHATHGSPTFMCSTDLRHLQIDIIDQTLNNLSLLAPVINLSAYHLSAVVGRLHHLALESLPL